MRQFDGIINPMDMSLSRLWGGSGGQGTLACCSSWSCKEWLNNNSGGRESTGLPKMAMVSAAVETEHRSQEAWQVQTLNILWHTSLKFITQPPQQPIFLNELRDTRESSIVYISKLVT